jgi:hypothetical protein
VSRRGLKVVWGEAAGGRGEDEASGVEQCPASGNDAMEEYLGKIGGKASREAIAQVGLAMENFLAAATPQEDSRCRASQAWCTANEARRPVKLSRLGGGYLPITLMSCGLFASY